MTGWITRFGGLGGEELVECEGAGMIVGAGSEDVCAEFFGWRGRWGKVRVGCFFLRRCNRGLEIQF